MEDNNYQVWPYGAVHQLTIQSRQSSQNPIAVILDLEAFKKYLDTIAHPDLTKLLAKVEHLKNRVLEEYEIAEQLRER